jgi:hypothetical protein
MAPKRTKRHNAADEPEFGPEDIVAARRRAGYGTVSTDRTPTGECAEGDVIPMRYEEAVAREDFEPEGSWEAHLAGLTEEAKAADEESAGSGESVSGGAPEDE